MDAANQTVSHFTINILEPPASGVKPMLLRVRENDANDINRAAKLVGLTQAEFLRTTTVQAARQIIAELTVKGSRPR